MAESASENEGGESGQELELSALGGWRGVHLGLHQAYLQGVIRAGDACGRASDLLMVCHRGLRGGGAVVGGGGV
eukprot:CAMPEP_0182491170 /NCGR_PEP_ID=MMETSP1321-20130603/738_1 /TAXON_ID=91990 /ORGANISM="Bolidomonas sp., Strain RCC1657" /LENGTH=73 /DNA_ID=CAMNT_0024693431 /DNA_START=37 /DNA_END=258 /DNA_ORIENTATION=+